MKTAGIVMFTLDLLKTLYTGYSSVRREKAADAEELARAKNNLHGVQWKPYVGIGMMVLGGAFLVLGRKKPLPN